MQAYRAIASPTAGPRSSPLRGMRRRERHLLDTAALPAIHVKFAPCDASLSGGSLRDGWHGYSVRCRVSLGFAFTCGSAASRLPRPR